MRTSELTGHALNWAVSVAEGDKVYRPRLGRPADWDKEAYLKDGSDDRWVVRVENPKVAHFVDWTYNPSGDWMQGGPIIEREEIELKVLANFLNTANHPTFKPGDAWEANLWPADRDLIEYCGPTPLVAAMRCYVASKLGDEVDVPNELTGVNK